MLDYRFPTQGFQEMFKQLWELEKPVVSAVNGTVAGIGWMFALLADLVVASESARWTHVFTRPGHDAARRRSLLLAARAARITCSTRSRS